MAQEVLAADPAGREVQEAVVVDSVDQAVKVDPEAGARAVAAVQADLAVEALAVDRVDLAAADRADLAGKADPEVAVRADPAAVDCLRRP